jgi:hypothetical protein
MKKKESNKCKTCKLGGFFFSCQVFDQSLQIHLKNETHSEFQDGMHCDVK